MGKSRTGWLDEDETVNRLPDVCCHVLESVVWEPVGWREDWGLGVGGLWIGGGRIVDWGGRIGDWGWEDCGLGVGGLGVGGWGIGGGRIGDWGWEDCGLGVGGLGIGGGRMGDWGWEDCGLGIWRIGLNVISFSGILIPYEATIRRPTYVHHSNSQDMYIFDDARKTLC